MKIKTNDAEGRMLDYLVAKCEGLMERGSGPLGAPIARLTREGVVLNFSSSGKYFEPSEEWAQGGPIIAREGIATDALRECGVIVGWVAASEMLCEGSEGGYSRPVEFYGPTPLIAAMRCYVASKLGDELDIPDELTKG